MWQHVKLSVQIRPWDTLACCWDVKQPTNKQTPLLSGWTPYPPSHWASQGWVKGITVSEMTKQYRHSTAQWVLPVQTLCGVWEHTTENWCNNVLATSLMGVILLHNQIMLTYWLPTKPLSQSGLGEGDHSIWDDQTVQTFHSSVGPTSSNTLWSQEAHNWELMQ